MSLVQGQATIIGGYTPGTDKCSLINRSGTAIAKGDLVALNLDFAATSGQAMVGLDPAVEADGATGYIFSAAIAVTTANARYCLAVALQAVPDNQRGMFGVEGVFQVKVNGGNAGEFIVGTNAQVYGTPYTLAELQALTTGVSNVIGVALEATTGVQLARCVFNGQAWRSDFSGDT